MQKPPLDVYVSPEASNHERSAVAESFEGFDVSLLKGEYRFSETAASLVVNIFLAVLSAAVYDLLKAGVKKLRSQPKSRIGRKTEVKISVAQKEYIIAPDVFLVRENTKETYFSSVEEVVR